MKEIKEAIKIRNGKPLYVIQMSDGDKGSKMQIYIRDGEVYFEGEEYGFKNYAVYDLNDEAHAIAKEMFLSSLQVCVKNRILELRQLETILDELGLVSVVRATLDNNVSRLLPQRGKIDVVQHITRENGTAEE